MRRHRADARPGQDAGGAQRRYRRRGKDGRSVLTEPSLAQRSLAELLESVAEESPAPGGGSTAAVAAALGAGLVEMAARFTLGRGRYAEQQDRMAEIIERAANRRSELLDLAERELHAYEPVLAAMRLPADDPEREARIREARGQAAEPPLAIARAAAEVAELAAETARAGNPNLVGDAVVGAVLAEAACRGAARLAEINLGDARTLSDVIKRAASAREEALA